MNGGKKVGTVVVSTFIVTTIFGLGCSLEEAPGFQSV